jgi:hypothetical protein
MGIFSFLGNIGAGIQGSRLGKKQMQLGQGMIKEGQSLSAAYERPEMRTPQAIQMMMEMAKGGQFEQMPGMTTMQNQIAKATAGGVSAMERMGTGAEAFGGVADLYAKQMGTEAGLGVEGARFQTGRRDQYLGALEGLGQWEQQAWNWNQADPYLQAQQKAAQLEQAGRSGEWEGLKTKMGSWAESFKGMGGALDETSSQLLSAFTPVGGMASTAGKVASGIFG